MLAIGGGAAALVLLMAVLPFLPFPMGIVTDAKHVYTDTVPAENRGAYLTTDDGAMQLYTWRVEPTEFPSDAPGVQADRIHDVVVVLKVYDPPEDYRLYELDGGHEVRWVSTGEDDAGHLVLHPPVLSPGRYMLVVPTDSMYGGVTRHYFVVAAPAPFGADT